MDDAVPNKADAIEHLKRQARQRAAYSHAAHVHDEAARTHAVAAQLFDRLGEPARAEREREKAQYERVAATNDRTRADNT